MAEEFFDRLQKADALARDVLILSRNTLLVNLRFLDLALSCFSFVPFRSTLATDGQHIFYNPMYVLTVYSADKEASVRDYLHMVFHCVFRHSFINNMLDLSCWDLACDIAVENAITELGLTSVAAKRQNEQNSIILKLKTEIKQLTAEKIYHYYRDKSFSEAKLVEIRRAFFADSHEIWYLPPNQEEADGNNSSEDNNNENHENNSDNNNSTDNNKNKDNNETKLNKSYNNSGSGLSKHQLEEMWDNIARRMQTDLETFSQHQGRNTGGLIQELRAVNREKYDYTSFLKKFAVLGERMQINDDEFDYIFYTYGLKLYKKMPLIEPLEYKEVKCIREFVIAIDTSSSVSGALIQTFLQKTYSILKSTESFFTKINLHIIQCDAEIQEDVKITSQEEFEIYINSMQIKGLGGTDFRPVFRCVDELRREKKFTNLKGLIYFTDGYGTFPKHQPDYQTAFVFIEDNYGNPKVPVWAIKLVLQSEEIYTES